MTDRSHTPRPVRRAPRQASLVHIDVASICASVLAQAKNAAPDTLCVRAGASIDAISAELANLLRANVECSVVSGTRQQAWAHAAHALCMSPTSERRSSFVIHGAATPADASSSPRHTCVVHRSGAALHVLAPTSRHPAASREAVRALVIDGAIAGDVYMEYIARAEDGVPRCVVVWIEGTMTVPETVPETATASEKQ